MSKPDEDVVLVMGGHPITVSWAVRMQDWLNMPEGKVFMDLVRQDAMQLAVGMMEGNGGRVRLERARGHYAALNTIAGMPDELKEGIEHPQQAD